VNTIHGKLIPDCPIGFRVEDGKVVREDKVLPPPTYLPPRRENPLNRECKGKPFTLTEEDAHVRLWGMAARKKARYSRAGRIDTQKLPTHLQEAVREGQSVLSR
jgi:hypothetical protein